MSRRRPGAVRWRRAIGQSPDFRVYLAVAVSLSMFASAFLIFNGPSNLDSSRRSDVSPPAVTPAALADATALTVASRSFSNSYLVEGVASNESCALLDLLLKNGSNELVLYDAVVNSTHVVQKVVPGGGEASFISMTAAGGAFYLSWVYLPTGANFWEKVTLAGKVSYPSPHLDLTQTWSFAYGNSSRLFVSSGKFLVALHTSSLTLASNYTNHLPANVTIFSVLPVGSRLYLAGTRSLSNGATNAYFGYLNLSSDKVTTISATNKDYPSTRFGSFWTLTASNTSIYVGGAILTATSDPFTSRTDLGLLFRFSPSDSSFANLSGHLPKKSWGVWGLEPWDSGLGVSLNGFAYNDSNPAADFTVGGVFDASNNGTDFANESSLFPRSYVPDVTGVTAESYDWFFTGGSDSTTGSAIAAAVNTGTESLGSVLAWGQPMNYSGRATEGCPNASGHYCYVVLIPSASGGLSLSDLALFLLSESGKAISWPTDGVTVSLFSPIYVSAVAKYSVSDSTWTLEGSFDGELKPGDSLVIYTSNSGPGQGMFGEALTGAGTNGFTGNLSAFPFP